MSPYEGCRPCLVEIENISGLPTYFPTPGTDGMVVMTKKPQLQEFRRGVLELILTEHPHACLICDHNNCEPYRASIRKVGVTTGCQFCPKNKQCELQEVAVIDCADGYSMPLHPVHGIVNPVTDSVSRIPEYKVCPVRLERNPSKNSG